MFRFAHTEFFWGLLLIPVLFIMFWTSRVIRRRLIRRYGNPEILAFLMPDLSNGRMVIKFIFLVIALGAIIFGLARPQFGSKLTEIKREGVEIVIALDVSNSMMTEDIQPNRLERAKQSISKLVERLADDKIGLIVFAGDAYTQVPITMDYISAKMFLSAINPEMVPKQGTAIGSAINLGMKSFSPDNEASKVLIIITDGENHEDDAVAMAKQAREKGITIHSIGLGLPQGAPIPVYRTSGQKSFLKDEDGNTVISKLNEVMLNQISSAGGGLYIRATNTRLGLNALFDEINRMEKEELEARIYSEYEERFQYLIGTGLILLILEFFIMERKNRYLKNIRLFNIKI
ncbi:MAG: VWA domain-containing protein [Bacteroidales bacterium]|nr:MAG: VWA domain-containing protein [Bacteroidales bacterium]